MNILAVDTATDTLSAALKTDKGRWYIEIAAGLRHSELLMEVCDSIIKMAEISRQDLNLVVCMRGPGSFTGLRIGFAAVKGISTALNIPFISIPTLDCMAHPYSFWPGYVLPVIDAKKQCFFTALYHHDNLLHDYTDASAEEILSFVPTDKPVFVCGPAAELFLERIGGSKLHKSSHFIAQKTGKNGGYAGNLLVKAEKQYIINNAKGDSPVSSPMYLRKSDAELSIAGCSG